MEKETISRSRIILAVFLCLVCLSVSQMVQMGVQNGINGIKGLYGAGNIISGIIYIIVVYVILKLICSKVLHMTMKECRIGNPRFKGKWIVTAVLLPIAVSGLMVIFPGELIFNNNQSEWFYLITLQVFVYGLCGGIVEEMIFRGVMMSAIEQRYGKKWAVIVPSLIFSLGHIANGNITPMSVVMIVIAGMSVAIMFSLIVYESDTIWNSAIIHIVWNAIILGGVINVNFEQIEDSIYCYVIEKQYEFLTGGVHSIEPSWIAIVGYCMVSVFAFSSLKNRKNKKRA